MPIKMSGRPTSRDNKHVLDFIREGMGVDYKDRIPSATQAGIKQTISKLLSDQNVGLLNQFEVALINRIGKTVIRSMSFKNPLAVFKKGFLQAGESVQKIQIGLLQARTYNAGLDSSERDLLGTETPPVKVEYHTVNRQHKYKVTTNRSMLERAFLKPEGLMEYVEHVLASPHTSDNIDEWLLMLSMFAEMNERAPFFKVNVPDISKADSDSPEAKKFLKIVQAWCETLGFPSHAFNPARMPVRSPADELVLFLTPMGKATLNVDALATLFHLDKANIQSRIFTVPEGKFGIPNCQGILTTREFFQVYDKLLETTEFHNPDGLYTNHWLHHHQIISATTFENVIMFTTDPGDPIPNDAPVTAATVSVKVMDANDEEIPDDGNVVRGHTYRAVATVTATTPERSPLEGVNIPIDLTVDGMTINRGDGVFTVHGNESAESVKIRPKLLKNLEISGFAKGATLTAEPEEWNATVVGKKITKFKTS